MRDDKLYLNPSVDDVVFQVVQWNAADVEIEDESGSGDGEDGGSCAKYMIKAYGVTEAGQSVSVTITDFTPFFMIKVHHGMSSASVFVRTLEEYVRMRLPRNVYRGFLNAKLLKKKDFWGYTHGDEFYFVRFTFTSLAAFKACERLFSRELQIHGIHNRPVRYKLYESNIEPFLRFLHIKDLQPAGWMRLVAGKYRRMEDVDEGVWPSTCQADLTCDWRQVQAVAMDRIAPLLVASFDLECVSSHGDFPVPRKDYKKVAFELMQAFYDTAFQTETLMTDIQAAFQHGVEGRLSKVFPRDPVFLERATFDELLLPKLERNIEDIANILRGKLVAKGKTFVACAKASKDDVIHSLTQKLGTYLKEPGQGWGARPKETWVGIFPPLEGDPIIQIGTTVHQYGATDCCFRHIITLGSCEPIEGVELETYETEAEMMLAWQRLIMRLDPDVMTGYNIFGFDMHYLYDRARELGITEEFMKLGRLQDTPCAFQEKQLSSSALGDNILRFIDMEGRVLIDIMKVVQRDHKLDSFKLDNVAAAFMGMNKHDVSPNDIFRLFRGNAADRRVVAEYCVQDCMLCNKLMMKLEILANNIGMANVCNVPLAYIFMRGQGVKIFSLVAKFCRQNDMMIPVVKKPYRAADEDVPAGEEEEGYEGAIVLPPQQGIYLDRPVNVWDYASLYPSSMISENLSHDMIVLDAKYDNLPGVEYLTVSYDVYEGEGDKKVKAGEKHCKFVQLPNGEKGIIPRILMTLLKARKDTRKKTEYKTVTSADGACYKGLVTEDKDKGVVVIRNVEGERFEVVASEVQSIVDTYSEFEQAVLDGLQLAYKVTANSLYGQIGARTSPIYLKDIAACTTATGRNMILKAKAFMEEHYKAEIVYGDSVTGYTPVFIREVTTGRVDLLCIEDVATKYGQNAWQLCNKQDKEACELWDVETWSEQGWTPLHRIIRHALAPHKKIVRVMTPTGVVDVTDDHSLLLPDKSTVSPADLKVGMELLHHTLPPLAAHTSLDSNRCYTSQLDAAGAMWRAPGPMAIHVTHKGGYRLVPLDPLQSCHGVVEMHEIPYQGYVYDLTTCNHHFACGVGHIIAHNTDSLFTMLPVKDENGELLKGHAALKPSIELAQEASEAFKPFLKAPHDLEYEKTFWPFILFSKKRYVGNLYEFDDKKYKQKSMGIALKRRDNANIVKKIFGGCIDYILNSQDVAASVEFLNKELQQMVDGKCPMEELIITKSLRADYKDPERIAHKVLAERMGERDPGNKPQVNDRIPYVYIQLPEPKKGSKEKVLQGNRIEHPDYIRQKKLVPDYGFYITNQIMQPVLQLYALALDRLGGYRKTSMYWAEIEARLMKEKEGDLKKVKDKLQDLREHMAKELLFDPYLRKLENKRKGNTVITDFFKK